MSTPQAEIDSLSKRVNREDIEHLRDDLAFGVAWRIVQYQDPALLSKMPPWVTEMVHEMCDSYLEQGSFGYVSNLGEVDHSEMMGKLVQLLNYQKSNKHNSN